MGTLEKLLASRGRRGRALHNFFLRSHGNALGKPGKKFRAHRGRALDNFYFRSNEDPVREAW